MIVEVLVGLALSVGITAGAVTDWNASPVASGWVMLAAAAALFMQYVVARDELNLVKFYRTSSRAAREQQRTAGLAVVLLLAAIVVVGAWRLATGFDGATAAEINVLIGWYICQTAYFGTLFFYLPSILSRNQCGVLLVCVAGAVTQLAAMAVVVAAVGDGNALIGVPFLVTQTLATVWAVGYDLLTYNDLWCCCSLKNHLGPRYDTEGYTVGSV